MRAGAIIWCLLFFAPLITMVVLDGFCSGRELCRAGLSFTLLVYGMGVAVCVIGILIARLLFRLFRASARTRILTLKALFLMPLLPGFLVLGLLLTGLLGRL